MLFRSTFDTTAVAASGGFIAKFDTNGNFLWATSLNIGSFAGRALALDAAGNIFVAAHFTGTTGTIAGQTFVSSGLADVLLLKFSPSGNALWGRQAGSAGEDLLNGLALDSTGRPVITGSYSGDMTAEPEILPTMGLSDAFLIMYDSDGTLLWARFIGGPSQDSGQAVAVTGSGNIVVTGQYRTHLTIGSTTLTPIANTDVFTAAYTGSGTPIWARSSGSSDNDNISSLKVDSDGNAYLTGKCNNPYSAEALNCACAYPGDIMILKYDPSGNALRLSSFGGPQSQEPLALTLDSDGTLFVTGHYSNALTIGLHTLPGNSTDMFLLRFANF